MRVVACGNGFHGRRSSSAAKVMNRRKEEVGQSRASLIQSQRRYSVLGFAECVEWEWERKREWKWLTDFDGVLQQNCQ